MQPQITSVYNSKHVWFVGSVEQVPTSNIFRFLPCYFGGVLDNQPIAIVLDPDQENVDFCVDQIRFYKERFEEAPIIVYSSWADGASVFPIVKAGVSGYLLKGSKRSLEHVVNAAIAGGIPLSSQISALLLKSTRCYLPGDVKDFKLTAKEIELLQMMSEGKSKKQISEEQERSIHTIDNHVRKIYLKMTVNSLGEAIGTAFRAGLIY